MENQNKQKIAFALGGLAGNNAFGAGFLQGAIDCQVKPDFISCSSGQIFWASSYLRALKGGEKLEKLLMEVVEEAAPYPSKDLNWMNLMTFGVKDVFHPISPLGYMSEMYMNMLESFKEVTKNLTEKEPLKNVSGFEIMQSWSPSRTIKPAIPDEFFEEISTAFNQSEIGIAFNAYAPLKGEEYVYLNEKARQTLGVQYGQDGGYRERTSYYEITPQNVKDALWLYQYGYSDGKTVIDGAYYRQILLSELVGADKIFVARPLNHKWLGELPIKEISAKDLQTEISFNGCYVCEKDKIKMMNNLIKKEYLSKDKYHTIDLFELEIQTQEGFFDYVFEKPSVFNDAKEMATKLFKNPDTWS